MQLPLDHVAIAVPSIADARAFYEALAGTSGSPVEAVPAQGVNVLFIGAAPGRIELIEPDSDDSGVARFIARRGAGLHHVAYRVDDLAGTLDRLAANGVELIDREPRPGAHGHRVAFIHPRSAGGVLVELVGD